jgi:ParB-like chromosome segregation protein Spo0J
MVKFVKKKIEELKPSEYNPRLDLQPGEKEYEKLKLSIREFGCVEPIVWNKRTGNIVGGHQRFKVLQEMGISEVEVSEVDLPEDKEKALNLALNKIQGDWDMVLLKELLEELDTGAFDVELTGFDEKEIENLMTQFAPIDLEEEDDAEEGKQMHICPKCGFEFED